MAHWVKIRADRTVVAQPGDDGVQEVLLVLS